MKLPYYFMTDMGEFLRRTSPAAEDVRIVQCRDDMFRPQVRNGEEWNFVTWEGIDLCSSTEDGAKKHAKRFVSCNAFSKLRDPRWEIKAVIT